MCMKENKKIKERILSIVLTFAMVMSLLTGMAPVKAQAAEVQNTPENAVRASHNHGTALSEATDVIPLEIEGSYYLSSDVTTGASITITGTVNLCLNGYVLNADTITVSDGATFNVYDCGNTVHRYTKPENGSGAELTVQDKDLGIIEEKEIVWAGPTGPWTPAEEGATETESIYGGILCSKIMNYGTFNLVDGTICGVEGIAIDNKAIATIGKDGAVIGNYNSTKYDEEYIILNCPGATFYNEGKINYNTALISTVRNDGGTFTNKGEINYNIACIIDDNTYDETVWDYSTREQTAAGGVANYSSNGAKDKESKFHNYGQINYNYSKRSSGGVLNKVGQFTNYESGQINGNTADRHCGAIDNTSNGGGASSETFFKNYGQVNGNKLTAEHEADTGDGGAIYNEKDAIIYNYGEICGNTAWNRGGGIYFTSGTLVVGGDSNITGNSNKCVNGAKTSNIYVGSEKYITFDTDTDKVLTSKAKMGVEYKDNEGKVTSGYTDTYSGIPVATYFFADNPDYVVVLKDKEVYLKDKTAADLRFIQASAGAHGSISPTSEVAVILGESITFTITADSGYRIKDVKVDGISVGAESTYTFSEVAANAAIQAEFTAVSSGGFGGGGSVAPSNPSTDESSSGGTQITVPVKNPETAVNVTAKVEENKATVDTIKDEELAKVTDTKEETTIVLVKHFCNTLFDKYLCVTCFHWC